MSSLQNRRLWCALSFSAPLRSAFKYVDESQVAFSDEIKVQGIWDQVTVVNVSEFGNTGNGSDPSDEILWCSNIYVKYIAKYELDSE